MYSRESKDVELLLEQSNLNIRRNDYRLNSNQPIHELPRSTRFIDHGTIVHKILV
jgi:hypothetical protein